MTLLWAERSNSILVYGSLQYKIFEYGHLQGVEALPHLSYHRSLLSQLSMNIFLVYLFISVVGVLSLPTKDPLPSDPEAPEPSMVHESLTRVINAIGGLDTLEKIKTFEYQANECAIPAPTLSKSIQLTCASQHIPKCHPYADIQSLLLGSVRGFSWLTEDVVREERIWPQIADRPSICL